MSDFSVFCDIDHPALLQNLQRMGIEQPTEVQERTIDAVLDGSDCVVSAPTGSGKTLAFLLPVMQALHSEKRKSGRVRALVLSPTRELARQIVEHGRKLCDRNAVNVVALTGGDHKRTQEIYLHDADLLVATPGRLAEYVGEARIDLSALQFLVVDEADRTLDMGFANEVTQIAYNCNPERQTLLFSATMQGSGVEEFVAALTDPNTRVNIHVENQLDQRSMQKILVDEREHVERLMPALLAEREFRRAMIFVNKREQADKLNEVLKLAGCRSASLHGEMDASVRKQVHKAFSSGEVNVLVATDLAARGLDISGVDLVINAELPYNVPSFIHRAGRTGRMGKIGCVISLVSAPAWNRMAAIERFLGRSAELVKVSGFESSYKGPKKTRASGKVAGRKKTSAEKKKSQARSGKDKPKEKKNRLRDQKNVGKRRKPNSKPDSTGGNKPEVS
ncbi:DEAD/DEAH box helicase [Gilvimarinus sp. SDUM040013]|uniref:DEAD/DEAH box helicase n=1 Tax=Gilvimarinus gilvus TaxID=3058038 RepID=A0ABU4S226_9GAMM|nr:DEAD/DEAH box helicase [Gilvimarinus sp. SDUM040013]MDO3384355.1 DEAD/DEAH box helicase [Gilvimarinus sp. SDUM040013]MDX6851203.1 DEAD/DEAH box helicase [Gilvimarinus sp. SDUM040013]